MKENMCKTCIHEDATTSGPQIITFETDSLVDTRVKTDGIIVSQVGFFSRKDNPTLVDDTQSSTHHWNEAIQKLIGLRSKCVSKDTPADLQALSECRNGKKINEVTHLSHNLNDGNLSKLLK